MKAAWYEQQGPARQVLVVGDMPDPQPAAGEVRIRVAASGINPGDLKKRGDAFGLGIPFPRIIPHSDGAGVIDQVGDGVPAARIGERVWCFGAQSYRPFGTAAEFTVVPAQQAIPLPDHVTFAAGACLGIPALTAHRAVHAGGRVAGKAVLVQGGAGGVGSFAVGLASRAGARVVATARSAADEEKARRVGAHEVVRTDGCAQQEIASKLSLAAPGGFDHIVEVAFDSNIDTDMLVLANGGSIAAYATGNPRPAIPFWDLLFKNARILLLGSDDFTLAQKRMAANDVNELLSSGWQAANILKTFTLQEVASAHEYMEGSPVAGRVVIAL